MIVVRPNSCKVRCIKQHIGSFKYNSGNAGAGWLIFQGSMFKEVTFQTILKPGPFFFSFLSIKM